MKIESGIPVPPKCGGGSFSDTARKMGVGDSVHIEDIKKARTLAQAICHAHGRGSGTQRQLSDGTYRVWRIDPKG